MVKWGPAIDSKLPRVIVYAEISSAWNIDTHDFTMCPQANTPNNWI